jgi:iron complex outermembrane receptor protein
VHHYKAVSDNSFYMGRGTLQAIVAYQQNRRQEFEESRDEPGLDFMLHTVNYDVKYRTPLTRRLNIASGVGGMWQRSLNKGDEYLIPAFQLFDMGVFGTATYRDGPWTLSGGLRMDHRHLHSFRLENVFDRFSRNFNGVTGSLGAVFAITGRMNLRANVARGFRAPNLSELASNGVHEGTVEYELGNRRLKPEYSWQADLGWDYTSPLVSASVSLFANVIDHYIFTQKLDGVKTGGFDTYQYVQGDARILGGEAMVDVHPVEQLHLENTFSYVNSVQRHRPGDQKYLPFTPAPRWTSDVRYDIVRDGTTLNNTYVALQMECNLRQNHFYALNGTETATPSYTLFNALAGTDFRSRGRKVASLYLSCDNIFNRAYQSHLSRLKYVEATPGNGRRGIFNMGRNFTLKLIVPLEF